MKPYLHTIQPVPPNIASSKGDMLTVEEQHNHDFELFRTDASITIISAMGTFVTGLATKVADMVELSAKSEWRARYGILKDYAREPHTLSAVASIRKDVRRHEASLMSVISELQRNSPLIYANAGWSGNAGTDFIERIDNADDEFSKDYQAIRRQIVDAFRPFKCSDPQMLYPLLNAIYMSGRFLVMARYIASFAVGFRKGEVFSPMLHLSVHDYLIQLAHRLNMTDKHGHPLLFIFNEQERSAHAVNSAKKSWQIKHRDNPPVVIDVNSIFTSDDITRLAWRLETHMMELKTIDHLIASSEGYDPMYRKDFSMKRIQSCANTYEQAMVNQALHLHKWKDLPLRMRQYIDSVNSFKCIDPRRRPKPVVCFHLSPRLDKKGNVILDRNGKPDFYSEFIGIWNSSSEAQREYGTPWQDIRKSVQLKAVNDGRNNIWLSLDDYLSMTYNQLTQVYPEVAEEFRRMIPELRIRSTKEIASETDCEQGTFQQAALT